MTQCRNIRKFLFEYSRSELDHERHKDIQMHLENCPECSAYFSEVGRFLSPITYCENMTFVKNHSANGINETFLPCGAMELTDDFWVNYDTKLFERLENTRRKVLFLYLPNLRPVFTEALAGLLVLLVLFILVEKGFLGYDLKTYIYLLKQVW